MAGGTRALPARFDQFRLTRLAGSNVLRLLLAQLGLKASYPNAPLSEAERTSYEVQRGVYEYTP